MAVQENQYLHALVDMGSNGIRFSISDLSPLTSRILPTVFQDRTGISLYDAQFRPGSNTRQPISLSVQEDVVRRLVRFRETCKDFGVPEGNITVLATEATRTAINSREFLSAIKESTGWDVQLLSKEEEGTLGAFGIASSLEAVEGLVMDLGGGSTQITWVIAKNGSVLTSPKGSISLPYGAAAVTKRLEKRSERQNLENEMIPKFKDAYSELCVPKELLDHAAKREGFDLFLSGGGFRGWGYLHMNRSKVNPYPIPIINGFRVDCSEFCDTSGIMSSAAMEGSKIFGISDRRASQVPAVACLVKSLTKAIPNIKTIQFCQGGVREGYLFKTLPEETRLKSPLVVATAPYSTQSAFELSSLLLRALPCGVPENTDASVPLSFTETLLVALANIMFAHSSISRESRAAVALHSTINGLLASAHGISHADRALLALLLYERWRGDLSPSDQSLLRRLRQITSREEVWWCQYLGRVAALVCDIYPSGIIRDKIPRVDFLAGWAKGKKGKTHVRLEITLPNNSPGVDLSWLMGAKQSIEKAGKKKNWVRAVERIGEIEDWGLKIDVSLNEGQIQAKCV
uniref:Retrograde regulation protein 2 n=1 Tax=Coccidioides posadasii RMSCC 3488 TaxID=454284 RepID=A0A0J6F7X8_COCPO|nr:retrograde regulation protein 2 [Coccidioides posadasii RMSCC 3488]